MSLPRTAPLASLLALLALSACASVEFDRTTETSGTFESVGWSIVVASIDLPKAADQIARENVSDANLANMVIDEAWISPNWGWWNWVLEIFSVKKATIRGTWGYGTD